MGIKMFTQSSVFFPFCLIEEEKESLKHTAKTKGHHNIGTA